MKAKSCNPLPRLINFRKPFVVFVGIMIGILLSYNFFVSRVLHDTVWWYYLVLFVAGAVLILSLVYLIFLRNKLLFERIRRASVILIILCVSIFFGVLITSFHTSILYDTYDFSGSGTLVANVCDVQEYEYGRSLTLDNITIETNDGYVVLVGKGRLYISNSVSNENIEAGSKIRFSAYIQANKIINYDDSQKLINGYGYDIELDSNNSQISIVSNIVEFKYQVKNRIKNLLTENMTQTNAGLAYSMLFGDKSTLDDSVSESFSISGVMHLLAVSGLHIGIISGAIYLIVSFITKKLHIEFRLKGFIDILIVALFLLFYMYLCDFSASVVRASIMVIVYLICRVSGFKYDTLTSLSIAGIIILSLSPLSLLTVGFQLSFLCIFAIITLVPKLLEITDKWHIPRWISSSMLTSIAINLIIMPVMLNCFGEASLISVFANILIIPLFSVIFPVTFFLIILSVIFPFISFVLFIPNICIQVLRFVVDVFAMIPIGLLRTFRVGYICLALIVLFAFLYKYLMCNVKLKSFLTTFVFAVAIVVACLNALPVDYKGSNLFLRSKFGEINSIFVDDGLVVALGNTDSLLGDLLFDLKISNINYLLLYNFTFKDFEQVKEFYRKNEIDTLLISDKWLEYEKVFVDNNIKVDFFDFDNEFRLYNSTIKLVNDYSGNILGVIYKNSATSVLYLLDKLTNAQYSFLGSEFETTFSYLISSEDDVDVGNFDIKANNVLYYSCENNTEDLSNYDFYRIKL